MFCCRRFRSAGVLRTQEISHLFELVATQLSIRWLLAIEPAVNQVRHVATHVARFCVALGQLRSFPVYRNRFLTVCLTGTVERAGDANFLSRRIIDRNFARSRDLLERQLGYKVIERQGLGTWLTQRDASYDDTASTANLSPFHR